MNNKVGVSYKNSAKLLNHFINLDTNSDFDFRKNRLSLFNDNQEILLQFNFPLVINLSKEVIKDKNLYNKYPNVIPDYIVMLVQTGNAALGVFREGKLISHKVVRKYMTRKKQGKSQLKYLKTKGKSRAGSRVRLANAVLFFEEINQRMSEWFEKDNINSIIYSCTPLLWGMLFQSKVKPPFEKKDSRLKKFPLNTGVPNHEIMLKAGQYAEGGYLQIFPTCPLDLSKKVEFIIHSPGE